MNEYTVKASTIGASVPVRTSRIGTSDPPEGYNRLSIETVYRGIKFRSRLEAIWAAFFDVCEWQWEYEPFLMNYWKPDFVLYVEGNSYLVEVKPNNFTEQSQFQRMEVGVYRGNKIDRYQYSLLLLRGGPSLGRMLGVCKRLVYDDEPYLIELPEYDFWAMIEYLNRMDIDVEEDIERRLQFEQQSVHMYYEEWMPCCVTPLEDDLEVRTLGFQCFDCPDKEECKDYMMSLWNKAVKRIYPKMKSRYSGRSRT